MARIDQRAASLCLGADPPLCDVAAFHCQQAAEKLLKGFLVLANADFRKTHDLVSLGDTTLQHWPSVAPLIAPMQGWTAWNIAYRHPAEVAPEPEPSPEERAQALEPIARRHSVLADQVPATG